MSGPTLTIYRGLPGSGKSTAAKIVYWAAAEAGLRAVHLEADMWHMRDGVYVFEADELHRAHRWCQDSARVHMENGVHVVVSNTLTTLAEMEPYFKIARRMNLGDRLSVHQMLASYGSIHDVPEAAMQRMRDRWVTLTPDMVPEGCRLKTVGV